MSGKDDAIKSEIERILQADAAGQNLIAFFDTLPHNALRRAISILSGIYPDKDSVLDSDFIFIVHMFSNEKYRDQESFRDFIRSCNLIDFSDRQKQNLITIVKTHFETLCEKCTFELDSFIMRLFESDALLAYMETLLNDGSVSVIRHIADILRYEDFSSSTVSGEALAKLKEQVSGKLQQAQAGGQP